MDLDRTFTYHKPEGTQPQRYENLRRFAKAFAHLIVDKCPDSRERSLALTAVQEAVMWANASIAIHENPVPAPSHKVGCMCPVCGDQHVHGVQLF
jgi:hypothetical protein